MLCHLIDAVEGLVDLLVALKLEGDGDDTDGEDAQFLAYLGDDRCCSRACAAAHARSDEVHLRAVAEHCFDVVYRLLGSQARLLGSVACSQTLAAQLESLGDGTVLQGLCVGVADHKRDVVDALLVHIVYGVAASTTHTDHLDDAVLTIRLAEVEMIGQRGHVVFIFIHHCCSKLS